MKIDICFGGILRMKETVILRSYEKEKMTVERCLEDKPELSRLS
jgi:hypothetical protein